MWLVDRRKIENCSLWLPVALAEDAAFPGSKAVQALGKSDVAGSPACLLTMNSMATLMRTEPADLTPTASIFVQVSLTGKIKKKCKSSTCPVWRLASRIGKQEESERPGKGTKPGDWMILSCRQAAAQATQQKCPSPQGTRASWKHSVRFLGPAGQREGVSHDLVSAYPP